MGKKDGKKVDKEKLEAKKLRQASKLQKVTTKRVKKEIKESGEDDIEAIIAEFSAKDAARVAVTITPCEQPTARANFSMTALPNGDMLLFGGEFCDGESTEVYNNLYRWNVEKNEWKHIESLNTPPPRCSHQSVFYKDKLYLFGGEYATLDQFHHYRDFWELDLKTSTWTEIKATGDAPNARSGHRMVVWRNFLVLFGGFYEAMREVRWYNDVYLYSFQDRRWVQVPYKANTQVPKPRSGVQMCVHVLEDCVYVYGGYSKEKVAASGGGGKKEGKVHEDMWCLNLKPMLVASAGARASGLSGVDVGKAAWQKVSRKGDFPSTRCGSGITMYKNKALLFGGVFDDEGPRHSLVSTFYNDLFAFDMERRRWYKLGLKQKKVKAKLSSADKKAAKLARQALAAAGKAKGDDSGEDSAAESEEQQEDEDSSSSEDDTDISALAAAGDNKDELFGYIDESGAVVYISMKDEEDESVQPVIARNAADLSDSFQVMSIASEAPPLTVTSVFTTNLIGPENQLDGSIEASSPNKAELREAETLKNRQKYQDKADRNKLTSDQQQDGADGNSAEQDAENAVIAANQSFVAKYFGEQTLPCPRINPSLLIKGNTLYIYGGVTELGDIEVTLDDCWSLDLNKRDTWKKVLPGSMHKLVWKSAEDEDGASSHYSSVDGDSGSDSEDDEDDDEDSEDDDDAPARAPKKASGSSRSDAAVSEAKKSGGSGGAKSKSKSTSSSDSKGGLRAEMEGLRSHFDMTDSNRTPLAEETLRQFYSRTTDYWASVVIAEWHANQEKLAAEGHVANKSDALSEKEVKRQGFLAAEARYTELLPLLSRLNELEAQQREEEQDRSARHDGKGKSSSSKKR